MLFIGAMGLLTSCNDKPEAVVQSATTAEEKVVYAYTIEKPDNWVTGSKQNTKLVLQSLKDFETGNVDASLNAWGDSVQLKGDYMDVKVSRDSLSSIFKSWRSKYKNMEIKMNDWESVKSLDGKVEYVSLWYVEKTEDQQGKWDSLTFMEDYKIENGKIVELDSKIRHFPKKQ